MKGGKAESKLMVHACSQVGELQHAVVEKEGKSDSHSYRARWWSWQYAFLVDPPQYHQVNTGVCFFSLRLENQKRNRFFIILFCSTFHSLEALEVCLEACPTSFGLKDGLKGQGPTGGLKGGVKG